MEVPMIPKFWQLAFTVENTWLDTACLVEDTNLLKIKNLVICYNYFLTLWYNTWNVKCSINSEKSVQGFMNIYETPLVVWKYLQKLSS